MREHRPFAFPGGYPNSHPNSSNLSQARCTARRMRGSKRKLSDGVWEVRVFLGRDQNGKVKHLSRTVRGSSREADAVLHELISNHADAQMDGLGMTFGQLLDRWPEECERLDRSPTTLRTYRNDIEKTTRPALGKVKLSRLGPRQLDALYGEMKTNSQSAKTIRNHHAIISSALHQAVRWGWVRENVASRARPPAIGHSRVAARAMAVASAFDALSRCRSCSTEPTWAEPRGRWGDVIDQRSR